MPHLLNDPPTKKPRTRRSSGTRPYRQRLAHPPGPSDTGCALTVTTVAVLAASARPRVTSIKILRMFLSPIRDGVLWTASIFEARSPQEHNKPHTSPPEDGTKKPAEAGLSRGVPKWKQWGRTPERDAPGRAHRVGRPGQLDASSDFDFWIGSNGRAPQQRGPFHMKAEFSSVVLA
jgi:hypothetical protein